MTKNKTPGPADRQGEQLAREDREEFLRQFGWSQELPEKERVKLEQEWSEAAILEALAHGF